MTGIIVLLLGILGAGLVYWTRSPDTTDDLSMLGYNKAETRQMGILYGKWGQLTDDLLDTLKRPGNQAVIILAVSALIAFGCFQSARWQGLDDEPGDGPSVK